MDQRNHIKSLAGRIGAARLHSLYDSRELTQPARQAFLSRFEAEVDPGGQLPPAERARRAEHAKRAHFLQLALRSAKARAARRPKQTAPADSVAGAVQEASRGSGSLA